MTPLPILLAILCSWRASNLLEQYRANKLSVSPTELSHLAASEKTWRYVTHFASLMCLSLLPFGLLLEVTQLVVFSWRSFGAAVVAGGALTVFKFAFDTGPTALTKAFSADVGYANQLFLATLGFAAALIAAFLWLILAQEPTLRDEFLKLLH